MTQDTRPRRLLAAYVRARTPFKMNAYKNCEEVAPERLNIVRYDGVFQRKNEYALKVAAKVKCGTLPELQTIRGNVLYFIGDTTLASDVCSPLLIDYLCEQLEIDRDQVNVIGRNVFGALAYASWSYLVAQRIAGEGWLGRSNYWEPREPSASSDRVLLSF
jgi:hypothetical protein